MAHQGEGTAGPQLEAALGVRRSSGFYIRWTLAQILRFARWHEGLDYLNLLAGTRLRAEPGERDAARTILAQLADVPVLAEPERAAELERLQAIEEEWRP